MSKIRRCDFIPLLLSAAKAVPGVLSAIGSAVGIGSSIFGMHQARRQGTQQNRMFQADQAMHQQNYQHQRENLDWQRQAQQTTWDREDTAVQRRSQDLQAAGINPLLAAGQAAQTSSPIHTSAAQQQSSRAEYAAMAMNMMKMRTDIARSAAEIGYMSQQAQHLREQDSLIREQKRHQDSLIQREALERDIRQYDWDLARESGLRTTDTGLAAQLASMLRFLEGTNREGGVVNRMYNAVEDKVNNFSSNFQHATPESVRDAPTHSTNRVGETTTEELLKIYNSGNSINPNVRRRVADELRRRGAL